METIRICSKFNNKTFVRFMLILEVGVFLLDQLVCGDHVFVDNELNRLGSLGSSRANDFAENDEGHECKD